MSSTSPRFLEYGESGDLAGARRSRRAFRLCVISCLLLTAMMWFTEQFLRYDRAEQLYLSALTLHKDSARVMLQAAIKVDAETRDRGTPKYTQALAVRSEEDVILSVYESAYKLDPTNALFSIRYGGRLYLMGYPEEAGERFREATGLPGENALPMYLEAASLAQASKNNASLRNSMVIVARTNNRGDPILLPRPLWFPGYTQDGYWYANLSREIVSETCAPLIHFTDQVTEEVEKQIMRGRLNDARSWLEQIRIMGDRLVRHTEPKGTLQAMAGIHVQLDAIDLLEGIGLNEEDSEEKTQLIENRVRLNQALGLIKDFETTREERIAQDIAEFRHPLTLVRFGALVVFGVYIVTLIIHKIIGLKKTSWTVPHTALGRGLLIGGGVVIFVILHVANMLQTIPGPQPEYILGTTYAWWTTLATLIFFGLIYPALSLKGAGEVGRKVGRIEEIRDTVRLARRAYRRVYVSLVVRYYGILSGSFIIASCGWCLTYRIGRGLYPWQIKLLASGLLDAEAEIINRVLAVLS